MSFRDECRKWAVRHHVLDQTEDRSTAAVEEAGYDLIGWRLPVAGKPAVAFAYLIVEDPAKLHRSIGDQVRDGLDQVSAYLKMKDEFKDVGFAGISVYGQVLAPEGALTEEGRKVASSAWSAPGTAQVSLHRVPVLAETPTETIVAVPDAPEAEGAALEDELSIWEARARQVERNLRELICDKLNDDPGKLPQGVQGEIQKQIDQQVEVYPGLDRRDFEGLSRRLEFTTLSQIGNIITRKSTWDLYEPVFSDRRRVTQKFEQLVGIRNPLSHIRETTEDGWQEGKAAVQWFERALAAWRNPGVAEPHAGRPTQEEPAGEVTPKLEDDAAHIGDLDRAVRNVAAISGDAIYDAVLDVLREAPVPLTQFAVEEQTQSKLGLADGIVQYVATDHNRPIFSQLVETQGLWKLLNEGKIERSDNLYTYVRLSQPPEIVSPSDSDDKGEPSHQAKIAEMRRVFSWPTLQKAIVETLVASPGPMAYDRLVEAVWQRMDRPAEDRDWNEKPEDPASRPLFSYRVSRSANALKAVDVAQSSAGVYWLTDLGKAITPDKAAERCQQHIKNWLAAQSWTAEMWREWSRDQQGYPEWYTSAGTSGGATRSVAPEDASQRQSLTAEITEEVVSDYLAVLRSNWRGAQSIAREISEQVRPDQRYEEHSEDEQAEAVRTVVSRLEALAQRERAERRGLEEEAAFDMWRLGGVGRVVRSAGADEAVASAGGADLLWAEGWARSVIRVLQEKGAVTQDSAMAAKDLNNAVADDLALPMSARKVSSLTFPTQWDYQTRITAVREFLLEPRGELPPLLRRFERGKTKLWALTEGQPLESDLTGVLSNSIAEFFPGLVAAKNYRFDPQLDDALERERENFAPKTDGADVVVAGLRSGQADTSQVITGDLLSGVRDTVSGIGLEYLWALDMAERGYWHVEVRESGIMGQDGDGGLDIQAHGQEEGSLSGYWVQVKNRRDAAGADEVRALAGAVARRAGSAMFVSVGGFTQQAQLEAGESDVQLIDGDEIVAWMIDAGVGVRVVDNQMVVDKDLLTRFEGEDHKRLGAVWFNERRRRQGRDD